MEILYFCLVFLLHGVKACSAMTAKSLTTDQFALLAFKAQISDPQNVLTNNWSISNPVVCNWVGISCGAHHRRVTALNLSSMDLGGTIPPHLGNLSFLAYLDLGSNKFTGILPNELGQLRRLEIMDFHNNTLSGSLPPQIGKLPNLREIHVQDNRFSGSIPWATINNISSLQKINFAASSFSGPLPGDLCNRLPRLELLDLSNNGFLSGQIPSTIGNCSELRKLSFMNNRFTGRIPESMANLSKLETWLAAGNNFKGPLSSNIFSYSLKYVRLGEIGLVGSIPVDICRHLPAVEVLYLDGNNLSGKIPKDITNCTSLKFLSLQMNKLRGEIPHEIGNLQNLKYLYLGQNSLTGPIPPSLFNMSTLAVINLICNDLSDHLPSIIMLPNLEELILVSNSFSGTIPSSISNSSKLAHLILCLNSFSGYIPNTFGNLRHLNVLALWSNYLNTESFDMEWSFLSSLTNCRNLRILDLADNPLYGVLPPSIGNFSESLQYFYADYCKLKGSVPSEICNLHGLLGLGLSYNNLNGSIPTTMGKLSNLQGFSLQNNHLHGSIPSNLCHLQRLVDLRLSGNQLSGNIPFCLTSLSSLRYLYLDSNRLTSTITSSLWNLRDILEVNLSSNSLTGSLPLDIQNLRALISLDLSRNQLSGDIPISIGGLNTLVNLSLAVNRFDGSIPQSFGHLISLESLDLSNNNLSGEIPKSLEALLYLKYFNVSYNRLEGKIPSGGHFGNFSAQSFMWNYALCGSPQQQVPPCKQGTTKGSNRTTIIILKFILPPIMSAILVVIGIIIFLKRRDKSANCPTQKYLLPLATWRKISYLEIQRATDDFSEYNLLGRGAFGSIYKGKLLDGIDVAIKVFNLELEKAFKSFESECEVFRSIGHRNLIKILSSCCNIDFKALVLEFMPNGSLEKWLYSHNNFLDILKRLNIMIDVALALEYLHHGYSTPVIHCDLKPNNILLDENMVAHVSDFGIARFLSEGDSMTQTITLATVGYMAPEYGSTGIVSTGGDVYSFGVLMMETFTRKKPTDEMFVEEMSLKQWAKSSLPHAVTEVMDANLLQQQNAFANTTDCVLSIMDLALDCLMESPEQRINMKGAVAELKKIKMKFVKDIRAT